MVFPNNQNVTESRRTHPRRGAVCKSHYLQMICFARREVRDVLINGLTAEGFVVMMEIKMEKKRKKELPPLKSWNWVNCGLQWLIVLFGFFFRALRRRLRVPLRQCLLVLERLSAWISGGEELCVWSPDFQLQCHRRNHSDTGRDAQTQTPTLRGCLRSPQLRFCSWCVCRNNGFDRAAQKLRSCSDGQRNW